MPSKVALVTGCSSGIGHSLVRRLLEEGWNVIATLRQSTERASLFSDEHKQHGNRLRLAELDVTNPVDRAEVTRILLDEFDGTLHCLVNNAGFGVFGAVADCSEELFRKQMEVNYFGLAILTNELMPALIRGRGHVINISSVLGFATTPLTGVYASSKHAVEGLSEALRMELAPLGVRVTLVEPGAHQTKFGGNVVWIPRSLEPDSHFAKAVEHYKHFLKNFMKDKGGSADGIVNAIIRALDSRSPPLRIRCGLDAHGTYWLRWLLPQRAYLWLTQFVMRICYYRLK